MEPFKRKPTRLKDYDYSRPGAYFITVCTKDKKKYFGGISDGIMHLSKIGEIVSAQLTKIEAHHTNIRIDKYVVMPNHVHAIILICDVEKTEGINPFPTKKHDISNVVGKFKAAVTRNVGNAFMHSVNGDIWQTSFHDHIIRGKADYEKIWNYIDTNVFRWELDCFYE